MAAGPRRGELLPGLFVAGCGMGLVVAPVLGFGLAQVPVRHAGAAAGVINNVQHIGGAVGIAAAGTVFFGCLDVGTLAADGATSAAVADATEAFHATLWCVTAATAAALAGVRLLPTSAPS